MKETLAAAYGAPAPSGAITEARPKEPPVRFVPPRHRQYAASLVLCTVAISVLSLALPVVTLQVYDRILPNPGTGTLGVLVTGAVVAVALEAVLRLTRSYVIGRVGASYEHAMACIALDRVLHADLSRLNRYGIGEYLNRMSAVGKLKELYNGYAVAVAAEIAFVPVFLAVIFYLVGPLGFVPLAVLLTFIAVSWWAGRRLHGSLNARANADDARFDFLVETLEGIHTVKAFALERTFERRYEAMEATSTARNHEVARRTSTLFNIGASFSTIMVAAIIAFGAARVPQGELTSGALIATLLLSARLMQPMQRALALWARYQYSGIAKAQISEILQTPQRVTLERGNLPAPEPVGTLSLEGVAFRRDDEALFENVDLTLQRGEAVLITGPYGTGKTTLLDLIAGIYEPTSGTITVDGADLRTFDPGDLARHVALVRADALIFRGTIRDNITAFGQIDARNAREVAALLEVDTDVAALPEGFDTALTGTGADRIPPGLIQRIAITRALAPKPRIILFDNADRALDRRGYATIYSLLARLKGRASMVLISDDENIRGLADRVFALRPDGLFEEDARVQDSNVRPYRELAL